MMPAGPVTLTPLAGIPIVREGDDVASLVGDAIAAAGIVPADFDVVVVTQKIVSKAEGRRVRLTDVEPSPRAAELAASLGKDPRMVGSRARRVERDRRPRPRRARRRAS